MALLLEITLTIFLDSCLWTI